MPYVPQPLALAIATRDYARLVDAGSFDSARPSALRPLWEAMGPAIWHWQYALRLTGQTAWRARPDADERRERTLVHLTMTRDVDTWERAMRRLDAIAARARALGDPIPDPLAIPREVREAIDARQAAALERVARRQGREGGTDGPTLVPVEVRPFPPPPGPAGSVDP
ncbi:hypothetical protein [Methylobacterium pseudosasicola]|uniref:hypothetical protein n=1 Tax=Methylobacterium pseudosasicola TaxID=582667 RepID=UPI000B86A930|nr:hypothetical protein [Methylobacterium pseudosasicola]